MTTTDNTQRMMDALKRARSDIASLTDWLELELDKQDGLDVTWATVWAIEHVRENLVETLAAFSGVEQSEIQGSLDELHS
jgi:hypothetical protein